MYRKKKNIVVKGIVNIDGAMPKGSILHSVFFALARRTNPEKEKRKKA
jgi:hypothetical protein